MDFTLTTQMHLLSAIVKEVRDRNETLMLTPNYPAPTRKLITVDGAARWQQDGDDFAKVRVSGMRWLRRVAGGYNEPGLVHPAVGVTFYVLHRSYSDKPGEKHSPVVIARLSDGRYWAEQWASHIFLWETLSKWRNAQGYLVDWQPYGMESLPVCAIGGLDWKEIPKAIAAQQQRTRREHARGNHAVGEVIG